MSCLFLDNSIVNSDYTKYDIITEILDMNRIRMERMMKRIIAAENTPGGMVIDSVTKSRGPRLVRNPNDEDGQSEYETLTQDSTVHNAIPSIKRVMAFEDALTRVQARTLAAVLSWHRMQIQDEVLLLNGVKVDLSVIKTGASLQPETSEEVTGSNLIEALEGTAKEVWDDKPAD